jgi:transcription initiation factor TFIIE subunit alpha
MPDKIQKLLKEIIGTVSGSSAEKVVDLLFGKKNVNEFIIAKKLNITINQTRNILYKLGDEGLVSFIRKKDKKKGGWYTYFWTLNTERCLNRYKDTVQKDIESLQFQVTTLLSKTHFLCKNCNIEYNEENALIHDYTCPECGETLEIKNPSDTVNQINNQIRKKEELLIQISMELAVIEKKELGVRKRKLRVELQKKAKERETKRKERAKEKKKLIKETDKLPPKKISKDKKSSNKPKKNKR